jgi:PAS domain S-box-containing protein
LENIIQILLIEDTPADAHLVEVYLQDCKMLTYELRQVNRMSEAIKLKQSGYIPQVMLLDMSLPDVIGIETVKKAVENFAAETAIIVLTGSDPEGLGLRSLQLGAQDYLNKDGLEALVLQRTILYSVERKRLQLELEHTASELRRSEAYLLQAQSIAKMGSYELNLDSGVMHWSGQVYKMLRKDAEEQPTLANYMACMPEADKQKVEAVLSRENLKVGQHFMIEHRIINKDDIHTSYIVMQGEVICANEYIKIIGAIQDVTDYKYAKELLLQSEERYRTIFEQSQDSIFIVSSEGNFIEFNKSLLQLIGYAADEMRYIKVQNLYVDATVYRLFEKQLAANGNVKDFEVQIVRKDGEVLDCQLNAAQWHSIDGTVRGSHGIIRDITTQKRTQALIKAKEVAEQSAKMKEQFLANMSHEIRTPMNVVIGMAHLLENTELSNKQKEYLSALKLSSDNLLKLINNILDFSKIESGKLELEKHVFNLGELLKELIQTYKYKAREKNINLFTQMDADIPDIIIGDSVRIYQILNNLISNAIKYTSKGEVLIKCELVEETEQYNQIKFSIKDTGIGIPAEKHARIFESFMQAGEETTRLFGGTGLGLSIVRKLVELHGSTVHLNSQVGKGSTFSFVIKFEKPSNTPKNSNAINEAIQRPAYKSNNIIVYKDTELSENEGGIDHKNNKNNDKPVYILLVEDHQLNQIVASDLIKKWSPNIQIDIAQNGQEAIIAVRKKQYDVVLMDISMPVMDGYEATTYIRKELPKPICDVPIIAMTAHAFNKNAEQCFEVGMNDFISKPINPNILYAKLSKVIEAAAQSKQNQNENNQNNQIQAGKKLINLSYLESLTGGDDDIKQIMLETLVRDVPDELKQLETDVETQNWNALKASAHKLKSTCAYMGLDQTADIARTIENNAWDKKNLDDIPELAQQLLKTCYLAHQELKEELLQMTQKNIINT